MPIADLMPDATAWTLTLMGLAATVLIARRRAGRRTEWLGLVSKLSGRVRED